MKVCFRLNLLLRILGCVFVFSSFFLSLCTFYLPYPVCSPDLLYPFCFLQKIHEGYEKEKKKLDIYKDTHHCLSIIFRVVSTGFRHIKVILLEMLQTETSLSQAWKSHPPKEAVPSVCSVNSSQPHGLWPAGLLCPRDSPGKNTGAGCVSSSRGSSQPRDQTCISCVSCAAGSFFTTEARFFQNQTQNYISLCSTHTFYLF